MKTPVTPPHQGGTDIPKDHGIGASTKRREDIRFLTGLGNYTDDINIHSQAYAHFLRSDVAHGRLRGIDTARTAAMPGVLRAFTGADFDGLGSIPCGWQVTDRFGEVMQDPAHPVPTWLHGTRMAGNFRTLLIYVNVKAVLTKSVRVNAIGGLVVMTGSHSHGQGHETAFPQVLSDMIEIAHGDTANTPMGYGSRSLAVGGSAMVRATQKIINKAKKIAAHLMVASEADIELKDGAFSVAWADVTLATYVPHNDPLEDIEPGLEETAFYDPNNFTYPAGAYACEVEVDPDTGRVTIERFSAADDFGNIVNPMIVDGQVHGGLGQGIGQTLLEGCAYDEDGQLLTGSYMDYAMPRADDVPLFTVDHSCQTPCTHNPLGVKGCGEAGAIGSPPAVVGAVVDALRRAGHDISHIDMPLSPSRVWAAMNE